jgi:hypothetical protein
MKKGDICATSHNGESMTFNPFKNDFVIDSKYRGGLCTKSDLKTARECIKRNNYTLDEPYFIPFHSN